MTENKTTWIVTKSYRRMEFEDLNKDPFDGGPLTRLNFLNIDLAASIYGAYCSGLEDGCVQIFDAVSGTEHGFFML